MARCKGCYVSVSGLYFFFHQMTDAVDARVEKRDTALVQADVVA
ncbi:hypothetical protein V1224_05215 [Lachnospiraceae bacterium JLR.KK008]